MTHIEADDISSAVQDALRGALNREIEKRATRLSKVFGEPPEKYMRTAEAELSRLPFTEALREVLDNL